MNITEVHDGPRLADVRRLFEEYAAGLAIDLSFQGFAEELASLPGEYAFPDGTLLLGLADGVAAGCVAVRRAHDRSCEMKRLYVRPAFQRLGVGRQLVERAITWAQGAGYDRMRLDTLPSMTGAQHMYERLGFKDIPPYRPNPIPGTRYLELRLLTGPWPPHVRRAVPGDESIVRALRLKAMTDAPDAFGSTRDRELARTAADWQRWLTNGATFILTGGAGAGGMVAGLHDAEDPAVVHLMSMWADPAVRGSGAADALVASLLSWAESEGARAVRLAVIETNDRARRFYERKGFRPTGRTIARERDGALELEMELTCAGPEPPRR